MVKVVLEWPGHRVIRDEKGKRRVQAWSSGGRRWVEVVCGSSWPYSLLDSIEGGEVQKQGEEVQKQGEEHETEAGLEDRTLYSFVSRL